MDAHTGSARYRSLSQCHPRIRSASATHGYAQPVPPTDTLSQCHPRIRSASATHGYAQPVPPTDALKPVPPTDTLSQCHPRIRSSQCHPRIRSASATHGCAQPVPPTDALKPVPPTTRSASSTQRVPRHRMRPRYGLLSQYPPAHSRIPVSVSLWLARQRSDRSQVIVPSAYGLRQALFEDNRIGLVSHCENDQQWLATFSACATLCAWQLHGSSWTGHDRPCRLSSTS
jgi:hypothetical protein